MGKRGQSQCSVCVYSCAYGLGRERGFKIASGCNLLRVFFYIKSLLSEFCE